MATVILEVPSDKIKAFVNMILTLGIEKNRILPKQKEKTVSAARVNWVNNFQANAKNDWDVYRNELEFE
jgi:hypothetical protein